MSAVASLEARKPGALVQRRARLPRARPAAGAALRYYMDARGRQHFNFAQQVWLQAQVPMAFTPVMSLALETLAINLLTKVTRQRDYPAAIGVTSRRVVRLARRFCLECLLTARAEGWEMTRATLRAWLSARSRL